MGTATDSGTRYVGFWLRVLASIIDTLILGPVYWGLLFALDRLPATPNLSWGAGVVIWVYIPGMILGWLYSAGFESSKSGATIGKMAIGARVVDLNGNRLSFLHATGRYFGKILSGLPVCLGYLVAAFSARKQALHDVLAGTLVVRSASTQELEPADSLSSATVVSASPKAVSEASFSSPRAGPIPLSASSPASIDQAHFDAVAEELQQNRIERGLWERAFAETDGDEKLQRARYIKYRVQQLADRSTKPRSNPFFDTDTFDRSSGHAILAAVDRGELPVNSVRPLDGKMPIHVIAALGAVNGVKFLIAKGSDVDGADGAGLTVLDYARQSGNPELVAYVERLFLERALSAIWHDAAMRKCALDALQGTRLSAVDAEQMLKACGWTVARTPMGHWRATNRDGQAATITTESDLANYAIGALRAVIRAAQLLGVKGPLGLAVAALASTNRAEHPSTADVATPPPANAKTASPPLGVASRLVPVALISAILVLAVLGLYLNPTKGSLSGAPGYHDSGIAKQSKGDLDGAIADYTHAIELDPKFALAYSNRGRAKALKRDLDGAIEDYTRAIELNPTLALAYGDRAKAKHLKGDLDSAISDSTRATELDPKFAYAFEIRGYAKQVKGDLDEAIADYNRAIEIDPNFAQAYVYRGVAKLNKRDRDGAIADYTRAIEMDPKDALGYFLRGEADSNFDAAIDDYTHAIELHQTDALPYYGRGKAKQKKGDLDGALADYTRAIELDPKLVGGYNSLAWLLATADRPATRDGRRAVELALKACELSQWKNAYYFDTLAAAYARIGNFDDAITWQDKAVNDPRLTNDREALQRLALYRARKAWPPD